MDAGALFDEGRRFASKLPRSGTVLLIADDDADGIISAHLLAKYLHKRSPYLSILVDITTRDEIPRAVGDSTAGAIIFLDLTPSSRILEELQSQGKKIFIIDHHPKEVPEETPVFNPHLFNIPHASRYNTGFLVYALFKDEIIREGDLWKVAISSFADSSYNYLRPYFYSLPMKKVEEASHMVGSVDREYISHLMSLLEEAKDLDDVLSDPVLQKLKKEFESTLISLLDTLGNYCISCEDGYRIILLPEERAKFKSAVSTVISKRNPSIFYAVGAPEGENINFSLRLQEAENMGIHLGKFASELARRWGTRGGGHAPASGILVPKEKIKEFVEAVKELMLSRRA